MYDALGRTEESETDTRRGIALAREAGEKQYLANGLVNLGGRLVRRGSLKEAASALEEGLALMLELGNEPYAAKAYSVLGELRRSQGATEAALAAYQASLGILERLGNRAGIQQSLLDAARRRLGDPEASRRRRRREADVAAQRARMADVVDHLVATDDSELAVMSMLRGADLQDALGHLPDGLQPVGAPRPDLRHDVIDDGHTERPDTACQWQVEIGEIDDDEGVGP